VRDVTYLLRRTLFASFDDGLFTIAKGAAYSALLSFFPILATVATVLLHARADFVRRGVVSFLAEILPPGTEGVVLQQFRYQGKRPNTLLIVAIVLSLWAASSVIKSLIDGFNAAYRVPRNRSILAHAAIGLMLALLEIVPLLGASSLIIFGGTVETAVIKLIRVDPILNPFAGWWEAFFRSIRYAIAFAATASLTAILYFYGPYRKQRWRGVWPGAILATVLWLIGTLVFGWYVSHMARYNVLYGSVGTAIALLIWMYVLSAIALFGCEFNAEYERMSLVTTPVGADSSSHP
jgi:membrane protein